MGTYLILGAGPVARATAPHLLGRQHTVTVGTRSGSTIPGCTAITLDASDPAALTEHAAGCDSILICTNPAYHRWTQEWPPIIGAAIHAARYTGARIVLMGNLYPFGKPTGRITQDTAENPTETKGRVRAEAWHALATSGVQATELRASDYFGPDAGDTAHIGSRFRGAIEAGKTAHVVGNPNAKHSWSYLHDIGYCLAELATRPELSGRYWVGPNSGDATLQELAATLNPSARVKQIPTWALRLLGIFSPTIREVARVSYQHTSNYLMDDTALRDALDFTPTPLDVAWGTCA